MTDSMKIIRDPLWNTIRLSETALRIIDTPSFQRLRFIRQLGLAHLVYPGATHTRFDHAVGVHHLTVTALRMLRERGGAPEEAWQDAELVPYAALLHDIGHYAYSHALEELEPAQIPADHEEISWRFFKEDSLREALEVLGPDAPERIHALIRGESDSPLSGLISGSLDLDKMEYLRRDARFCGVPYGEVDVDRLLEGLVLLQDPETGRWETGVHEKAVAAMESLLFAKYQMFRNVYWHHGVRAATALYKRIVEDAVRSGVIDKEELVGPTDEELLYEIHRRAGEMNDNPMAERLARKWIPALRQRRLPKRALEMSAADLHDQPIQDWVVGDSVRKRAVEDRLAIELGLESGEVVIDFPQKTKMFQIDTLIRRRNGAVERLGPQGIPGVLDLPRVAADLQHTARALRVFTFERRTVDRDHLLELLRDTAG